MTNEELVEGCIRAGFQEGLKIADLEMSWDEFLALKNDCSKDGHSEAHSTYQVMEAIAREAVKITGEACAQKVHEIAHSIISELEPISAIKNLTQGKDT